MNVRAAATLLCILAFAPPVAHAGDPRPALSDLAFLEGHWTGESDGEQVEEIWTAPQGGSIVGVSREMKDGRTTFYELLVVQMLDRGPVLRLKHFGETLVGWEDKDKTTDLPLVRVSKGEAVFESDDKDRLTRLTYRRESPTSLVATLERKRDGKLLTGVYRFTSSK